MNIMTPELEKLLAGSNDQNLSGEKLEAFAKTVCDKRDEAIKARKSSGIEDEWLASEEQYIGVDDANRGEFAKAKWAKPMSTDGPVTTNRKPQGEEVKSTVYIPLTRRYVDAGSAKLIEILLPPDDKAFSFGPTPVPELAEAQDDKRQVVHQGLPLTREPTTDEQQAGQTGTQPVTVKDFAEEKLEKATEAAKKAETRIYDWMVESKYIAENRKVIADASRIGVGVLKAPFPIKKTDKALKNGALEIIEKTIPGCKWVDPWNFYPDAACGDDIHNGSFCFERDFLSPRQVEELKGQTGYLNDQLDKVLKEGPNKSKEEGNPNESNKDERYPTWYGYGFFKRDELETIQTVGLDKQPKEKDSFYAIVTLINDTPVKAVINPLDSGEFPYHAVPWSRRSGSWAGVGVAEQMRAAQRIANAATRAMLNNAGKTAGSQVVMNTAMIIPADGNWTLTPDKVWKTAPEASVDDIRKAFAMFEIPDRCDSLKKIIDFAFQLAEESTSIPLITQGQSGPTTPDTLGATQLQDNNANQLLRTIGYAYDDYITEPVVRQYYEMLLLDPDVPDEEKGDFEINAHGSVALVEHAIQDQTIASMGSLIGNAAFGIDPKKWLKEWMKSKRLNPVDFQYSEAEMAKIESQPAPPPLPLQVAQLRAQTDEKIAAQKSQTELAKSKADTDRDTVYVNAEAQRDAQNNQAHMSELQLKRELALLEYANKRELSLEQIKAELAKTSMIEHTKKELAGAELLVTQHMQDKTHLHELKGAGNPDNSLVRDELSTEGMP